MAAAARGIALTTLEAHATSRSDLRGLVGVAAAEGVADEAGVAGEIFRRGEFSFLQLRVDRGLHRGGIGEGRIGDVEERNGRGEFFRGGDERGPLLVVFGAGGKSFHRALEEPEADDVGERAIATIADALVGDAGGEGVGAEDGLVALEADERPRAGAQEEIGAVGRGGHRIVGGGGVMAGDGDDLGAGEFGEILHFAEARAGENRLCEPLRREAEMFQRGG